MNYRDIVYQYHQAQWDAAENNPALLQMLDQMSMLMFNKPFSALSPSRQQTIKTIMVAGRSAMFGITEGDPLKDAKMFMDIHQGIMSAGPLPVNGVGGARDYGFAYGAGNITMSVARQLADYYGGESFGGMDKGMLGSVVGQIIAKQGVLRGGVHTVDLGKTAADARNALRTAKENGIGLDSTEGRALARVAAAREQLDRAAAYRKELKRLNQINPMDADNARKAAEYANREIELGHNTYAELSEEEKRNTVEFLKTTGIKSFRKGKVNGQDTELLDSDIEGAVLQANGKFAGELVDDKTKQMIDDAVRKVQDNITDLSHLFGTKDFNELQAAAEELRIGSLTDAKNVKRVKEWIRATTAIAYGTNRDVREVIKEQAAIATALGPGASSSIILGTQKSMAAFTEEETRNGGNINAASAEERTQAYVQNVQNANNFSRGLYAMRKLAATEGLPKEVRDKAAELVYRMEHATSEDEYKDLNRQASAEAERWGMNINDPRIAAGLEKNYATEADVDRFNMLHADQYAAQEADEAYSSRYGGLLKNAGIGKEQYEGMVLDTVREVGGDQSRFSALMKAVESGKSEEELARSNEYTADEAALAVKLRGELADADGNVDKDKVAAFSAAFSRVGGIQSTDIVKGVKSRSAVSRQEDAEQQSFLHDVTQIDTKDRDEDKGALKKLMDGLLGNNGEDGAKGLIAYAAARNEGNLNSLTLETTALEVAQRSGNKELEDKIRNNPDKYFAAFDLEWVEDKEGTRHFSDATRKKLAKLAGVDEKELASMTDSKLWDQASQNSGMNLSINNDNQIIGIGKEIQDSLGGSVMKSARSKYGKLFEGMTDEEIRNNYQFDTYGNIIGKAVHKADGTVYWARADKKSHYRDDKGKVMKDLDVFKDGKFNMDDKAIERARHEVDLGRAANQRSERERIREAGQQVVAYLDEESMAALAKLAGAVEGDKLKVKEVD